MSHDDKSSITLCRYWVKAEREPEFRKLLDRHWPLFTRLGLVRDQPPHLVFRGEDPERGIFYVETFPWKDAEAAGRAHSLPEVAAVWERAGGGGDRGAVRVLVADDDPAPEGPPGGGPLDRRAPGTGAHLQAGDRAAPVRHR